MNNLSHKLQVAACNLIRLLAAGSPPCLKPHLTVQSERKWAIFLAPRLAMLCSKPSPRFASSVHKRPTNASTTCRQLRKQGTKRAVHVRAQEAEQPATKRVSPVQSG